MRAGTTSVALAIGVAVLAPVGQAGAATSRAETAGPGASAPSAFDPTGSEWSVNNHAIHWLFREGGLVEAPGAWRGHWTMSGGEVSVEIGGDRFTVRFDPDGQSFTAYKAGQVYRNGVRVRGTASVGARAGDPSERSGGGYWRLERVDFSNQAGADTWTGQAEMRIALTSHDNSHMSFREVWRATTSEAYTADWSIPDILRPGETAPFALSETCLQSTLGQGWPFPTIPMAPVSLVSDFNRDAYLQLGDPPCTPGATAKAGPPLTWTIPAGKPGDTTKVRVSAGPTYWSSVDVTWLFRWSEGTAPPASAGRTPATAQRCGVHLVLRVQTDDALRVETEATADRLREALKTGNLPVSGVAVTSPTEFTVTGVPSAQDGQFRQLLANDVDLNYDRNQSAADYSFRLKPNIAIQLRSETVDQALQTIERRVNELGVAEPLVARHSGADQILVQLPGVSDVNRAKEIIRSTSLLELKLVEQGPFSDEAQARQAFNNNVPPDIQILPGNSEGTAGAPPSTVYYAIRRVAGVTGRDLRNARASLDENNRPAVSFSLTPDGAAKAEVRDHIETAAQIGALGVSIVPRFGPPSLPDLSPLGTTWEKPFLTTAPWLVVAFREEYGREPNGERIKHYYVSESAGIACGFFIAALISFGSVARLATILRSTTETFGVGTRIATPSSLPFSSGSTRPIAFAAPVEVGIIDIAAARPR